MKLTTHCYAVFGLAAMPPWVVNAGFVVGQTTTLLIDTGMNTRAAQTILGYAQAICPQNRIVALNSEPHFDHIGGNGYLQQQGIDLYGHPDIRRSEAEFAGEIAEYNDHIRHPVRRQQDESRAFFAETSLANPHLPVTDGLILDLGSLEAQIIYTPGHTAQNLSLFVPKDKVLFCGDCLVGDYVPNLEAGNPALWQQWLESLAKIEELAPNLVMPGHGGVMDKTAVFHQIARHRTILQHAIQTGVAPTQ